MLHKTVGTENNFFENIEKFLKSCKLKCLDQFIPCKIAKLGSGA